MKKLNIMYISYWSLSEPLTASTILPHMGLLEEDDRIGKVILVTVEHPGNGIEPDISHLTKMEHLPIKFRSDDPSAIDKAKLFLSLPNRLAQVVEDNDIGVIDSKASLAGILAYKVSRKTGRPFIVESFEPHSTYMLECDIWRKWSPYYLYNRFYEKKQIKRAKFLVTVTENYRNDLIAAGIEPTRVIVVPSITDMDKFVIDETSRENFRKKEGIPAEAKVGIYVGKFGGLYLEEEAYWIMGETRAHFGDDFHVVILTPQDPDHIREQLRNIGFADSKIVVRLAAHKDVPKYLAASDLAFSPIRYTAVKAYQSPVKNGEYWACGLPILLTDKVSDDFWIIRKHKQGGALYDLDKNNLGEALVEIEKELAQPDHKEKIRAIAKQYRSFDIAKDVYKQLFDPTLYLE